MVAGKPATYFAEQGGVDRLMRFLEAALGRPQIAEFTEHLNRYFRNSRRKPQESINEYVTRKSEIYLRAQQGYRRLLRDRQTSGQSDAGTDDFPMASLSRRTSLGGLGSHAGERQPPAAPEAGEATTGPAANETTGDAWDEWYNRRWEWQPWSWQAGWGYQWGQDWGRAWGSQGATSDTGSSTNEPELIPPFLQGWYLLNDSGLDTRARNAITTALQGSFDPLRVAQELRTQWADSDLKRHDHGQRHSGYWGEAQEEGEEDDPDDDELAFYEDLSTEDQATIDETRQDIENAMAVIQTARRTLKAARARQHEVKLGRQYFHKSGTTKGGGKGAGTARDDSQMTCLKCGKVGHRAANCDVPRPSTPNAAGPSQQSAPFVCFTDDTGEQAWTAQDQDTLTTAAAVAQGRGVIDGGATKTIGSVYALERIMSINQSKKGRTGVLAVDTKECPVFGFGNSTEERCVSTMALGLQADGRGGQLRVHALDRGTGPVLISIDTLRKLGAVIDFKADVACFRNLNDRKLVPLERSSTGHQMLPLTDDILANAIDLEKPVLSLRDLPVKAPRDE
jgi:hypothetical protein